MDLQLDGMDDASVLTDHVFLSMSSAIIVQWNILMPKTHPSSSTRCKIISRQLGRANLKCMFALDPLITG